MRRCRHRDRRRAGEHERVAARAAGLARRLPHGRREARRHDDRRRPVGRLQPVPHGHDRGERRASKYEISRAQQDEFAVASQNKAEAAQKAGKFKDEIVPVTIPQRKGDPVAFATDEFVKAGTTLESISGPASPRSRRTAPSRRPTPRASTTARAAVLVMTAERATQLGFKPLAKIKAFASAGVDPAIMGMGPVPASRRALEKAGWKPADLDLMEINEAFAAQACAVNKEMGWDTIEDQRQRRRDRARPSDRRVGLPRAGHAAARDAPARREEGSRVAVHRRRHGRRARRRALEHGAKLRQSPTRRKAPWQQTTARRAGHRRHGRSRRSDLHQAGRAGLHGRDDALAGQHQGGRVARRR